MSNIFQIKRGHGTPNKMLAPYELGINIDDSQLYFGGPINDKEYGQAQGIKVAKAEGAIKIIDANGNGQNVGSATGPIYLSNGIFLACGDGTTISGTIEYAKALNPGAEIIADLETNNAAMFNGAENSQTTIGTTGILPITKGGTGAGSVAAAINNLGAVPNTRTINTKPLSEDIKLTAEDVGAVPKSRTINNKELSGNIELKASDISGTLDYKKITIGQLANNGTHTESFKEEVTIAFLIAKYTSGSNNRSISGIWTPEISGTGNNFYGLYETKSYRTFLTFENDNKTITIKNESGIALDYTLVVFFKTI